MSPVSLVFVEPGDVATSEHDGVVDEPDRPPGVTSSSRSLLKTHAERKRCFIFAKKMIFLDRDWCSRFEYRKNTERMMFASVAVACRRLSCIIV